MSDFIKPVLWMITVKLMLKRFFFPESEEEESSSAVVKRKVVHKGANPMKQSVCIIVKRVQ